MREIKNKKINKNKTLFYSILGEKKKATSNTSEYNYADNESLITNTSVTTQPATTSYSE